MRRIGLRELHHAQVDVVDPLPVERAGRPRSPEVPPRLDLAVEAEAEHLRHHERLLQGGVGEVGIDVDAQRLHLRAHADIGRLEREAVLARVARADAREVVVVHEHLAAAGEREATGFENRLCEGDIAPNAGVVALRDVVLRELVERHRQARLEADRTDEVGELLRGEHARAEDRARRTRRRLLELHDAEHRRGQPHVGMRDPDVVGGHLCPSVRGAPRPRLACAPARFGGRL